MNKYQLIGFIIVFIMIIDGLLRNILDIWQILLGLSSLAFAIKGYFYDD